MGELILGIISIIILAMAIFTILSKDNSVDQNALPLKMSDDIIKMSNSNIKLSQFEYSINQL